MAVAAFTINKAVKTTTSSAPQEIDYGRLPALLEKTDLQTSLAPGASSARRQWDQQLRHRLDIRNAQLHQKKHDRHHLKDRQITLDDSVWVHNAGNSSGRERKLHDKYITE